jgi:hypothetical protein
VTPHRLPVPGRRLRWRVAVVAVALLALLGFAFGTPVSSGSALVPATGAAATPLVSTAQSPGPGITIHLPMPTWINVTSQAPNATPPTGEDGSAAYDPELNETVYFGGCNLDGVCPDNFTYVFSDGVWTNETNPYDAPPAREDASMDYDANMQAVLLFGGLGNDGYLNDTWIFQNDTWTNVTFVGGGPSPREGAGMVFDPEPEENGSVLFGGCSPSFLVGYCLNDTWVWQGWSGWVLLTTSIAPSIRGWPQMAYDPDRGAVVLFGGLYGFFDGEVLGGTYELYAGQWWALSPTTAPPAVAGGGLVFDPGTGTDLLFGGENATGVYQAETWSLENGSWTHLSPDASPPAEAWFGLSLDGTGSVPLLVGGATSTNATNATWVYQFPVGVIPSENLSTAEVGVPVTFGAEPVDGTPPYTATFTFGDGGSETVEGSGSEINVTHAFAAASTYTITVALSDAVGDVALPASIDFPVTAGPAIVAGVETPQGDVGVPVHFSTTVVASGAGSLTYAWRFGDDSRANGPAPHHTYGAAKNFTATETATDADGVSATSTVLVTIVPDPTVAITATSTTPGVGDPVTFFANVTGGTAPFAYAWVFAKGNGSALPAPVHPFDQAGTFPVEVWVNDSVGGSANAMLNVTVAAAATSPAFSLGGAPGWFWGGLGAIAAVGAVGGVLLARRKPRP